MTATKKALVLCSGGVDSSTLLAMAVREYGAANVVALSISYGQRHSREIQAAKAIAAHYGVEQRFLDLAAIFADSNCSLLAHSTEAVPESTYAEQLAEAQGAPVFRMCFLFCIGGRVVFAGVELSVQEEGGNGGNQAHYHCLDDGGQHEVGG